VSGTLAGTLAARLREERRKRGLSLRALAAAARLSTTTVHQVETGRGSPSLATLQALSSVLDVPLGSLFEGGELAGAAAVLVRAAEHPATVTPGGTLQRLATGLPGQRLHGLVRTLARRRPRPFGLFTPFYPRTAAPGRAWWTTAGLADWLRNPRSARPGTTMPPVELSDGDWRDLPAQLGAPGG
jgi:transcriptional regulator with XRE-family HTH domain